VAFGVEEGIDLFLEEGEAVFILAVRLLGESGERSSVLVVVDKLGGRGEHSIQQIEEVERYHR